MSVYYACKSYKLKVGPMAIFEALKEAKNCFFLDSSLNSNLRGRYSFLGIEPFYILKTKGEEPFTKLREFLEKHKFTTTKPSFPFIGGAVGYFGYDLGFLLENKLKKKIKDDLLIPDCFFAFYNTVLIIDNLKKVLSIFVLGFPEKPHHLQKALCEYNLKKIETLIFQRGLNRETNAKFNASQIPAQMKFRPALKSGGESIKSNFTKQGYIAAILKAKEYIRVGDIYQVNLSQRFKAQVNLSSVEIYRRLRDLSPAYFNAYFDAGDFQILSSSPERFLKLERDAVITHPMKGTRRRGRNKTEDSRLKKQLLNSPKDRAELMMIIDLERNDLGKVCDYNSISVKTLRQIEEYRTVYQATAVLKGRLYKDKDRIDLLSACFPGGSITGCPKIRAMEIIEELEPSRRFIYTGSLGYLSFCGNLDFNILIRTILKKEDKVYFGAGGGIVADSEPEAEYEETLIKARAMMEAIG
ncbi:MAG: aminodeoxychorismate synthase component I [Candidatus Omnitrophota bacterium]|nr:aminodeoxychorismate synthase component I [Candidatus Omnitrophota bacterium]